VLLYLQGFKKFARKNKKTVFLGDDFYKNHRARFQIQSSREDVCKPIIEQYKY
jgi:hypothetical protein